MNGNPLEVSDFNRFFPILVAHPFSFNYVECLVADGCTSEDACTSRKPCQKESQSLSHCGSFDHPDLQSLNDYNFFCFVLRLQFSVFGGCVIYRWKDIFKAFQVVY